MNGLGLGYPNPVRHPPLEARTRGVSWYGQPSSSLGLGWATRLPGPRDRLEMLGTYVGIINPGGIVPFFLEYIQQTVYADHDSILAEWIYHY